MATINKLKVKLPHTMANPAKLVEGTGLVADRLAAVAHQFFLAYINGKHKAKRKDGTYKLASEWFTVDSRILKSIGSSSYAKYVDLLVANGIIEPRMNAEGQASYLPGHRSKQYRFIPCPVTITGIAFREYIIKDRRTIKSILRTRDNYTETPGCQSVTKANVHLPEEVVKFLQQSLGKVSLDHSLANQIIDALPIESQDLHRYAVENINDYFSIDAFGHRLHSSITNLKKELRHAIRFDGEGKLCVIDINNSQPFFASILPLMAETLLPSEYPVIQQYLFGNYDPSFFHGCKSGNLYDRLAKKLRIKRKDAKKAFFRGVMFRNRVVTNKRAKAAASIFKTQHPVTDTLFSKLRNLTNRELEPLGQCLRDYNMKSEGKFRRHKLLPLLMQRMESAMVYRHIIPAFIAAGIGPVLTIHDSFIIPARHNALAVQVITESFTAIGIEPPMLTVELLGEVDIQKLYVSNLCQI